MPAYSEKNYAKSATIWQENSEGLEEVAIVVSRSHDGLSLSQRGSYIYIDETCLKEVIKVMRDMIKEKP